MYRMLLTLGLVLTASLTAQTVTAEADPALATRADDPDLVWGPCPPFFAETCRIAVLHGSPEAPNADVFFKVAPGEVLPHHWHTSAERMVLVAGRLEIQYDGQAVVMLEPGTYAYGPPKHPHLGKCQSSEACVLFIAFEGPVDAHLVE